MIRKWRVVTNKGAFMVYAKDAQAAKRKIMRSLPDMTIIEVRQYKYASPKRKGN